MRQGGVRQTTLQSREIEAGAAGSATRPMQDRPRTVIAIPTLDEADHIGAVLDGLRADGVTDPVLVLDGGSRDATRTIVQGRMNRDRNLYLIDNPEVLQAAAVNRAAHIAREMEAEVLIRLDAHARYPSGFVAGVRATLDARDADSVVVPLIAAGAPGWQAAAALLQRGWLGHGGAAHRRVGTRGWVRHGHHAAFRLDRFLALGGYRRRFAACEDVDFDLRLTAAGGRLFLEDRWPVSYRPRRSPAELWAQMHRNGRWRVAAARAHGRPLAARQMLPLAATGTAAASLSLAALHPALLAPAAGYLAAVFGLSAATAPPRYLPRVAILALVAHAGFASGLLHGMAETGRSTPRPAQLDRLQARLASLTPAGGGTA